MKNRMSKIREVLALGMEKKHDFTENIFSGKLISGKIEENILKYTIGIAKS